MQNISKKLIFNTMFAASMTFGLGSCSGFLDVVPDNTLKIENIFSVKEEAYNGLSKIYYYMPDIMNKWGTSWYLGDEYYTTTYYASTTTRFMGARIMRGLQTNGTPLLGYWSGTGGATHLYRGIRAANIFLENIDLVQDMSMQEKAEWVAQAKFLKGYFTFLLISHYGPVVLADEAVAPDAMGEEFFQPRQKVDDCFDFVIKLMDEAIPDLNERQQSFDYGMIDRVGAAAIKARVMLFRASPFYNGNKEMYSDFLDRDGKPFFNQTYDKEKWKDALDAVNYALELADRNMKALYTYDRSPYVPDRDDWDANEQRMQTLYNLRFLFVDKWNKELLWGYSNYNSSGVLNTLSCQLNIMLPNVAEYTQYGGTSLQLSGSEQCVGTSYAMLERFYTANGLPIDEDATFDKTAMYDIFTVPDVSDSTYEEFRGYFWPAARTINLYRNREPRFYADMGITGGYWRAHNARLQPTFFMDDNSHGGGDLTSYVGQSFIATGIGIQKLVHPESTSNHAARVQLYPYSIIRLADLYLMKAEIMNEYYGPSQEVYDLINLVRDRAGVPHVEDVWSNPMLCKSPGRHLEQTGLRDIILQERSIEFAFEGIHFWDMYRWKRATQEFSQSIYGWNYRGTDADTYFIMTPYEYRKFSTRDYLWPIPLSELNINKNLIQNPGWK